MSKDCYCKYISDKCNSKCCYKHNYYHCKQYSPCIPCPPVPPKPIEKKAIALLEFGEISGDEYIVDSLYFTWYQDNSLPRFPVIKTNGTIENNLELLNKYYKEGYRYFLGFSRSTIVSGVLEWFLKHPDAIGISLSSGAISLSVPKNIYRLITTLNDILPIIDFYSKNADNIYYIYNEKELISQDMRILLENNPLTKNKLKSYPIINDSSYNVSDISSFLNGSTSNDIILLGIFEPTLYSNLYNEGLNFEGNQYTVVGIPLDINNFIEPCATKLDRKYFNVDNVYTNTSLLYRENLEYLVNKYGTDASNGNIQNAMKMIQYFLLNKNIDYLGSYYGTLEFDANKDLKYSSYLITQYVKEINNFENYAIYFDDPLLGKFEATFV